ncbi:unnamed protein product [Pedinophyceae sp. YPF-701]|nr:unnamed protein product [Pedinophyceae sp. YPF-701]
MATERSLKRKAAPENGLEYATVAGAAIKRLAIAQDSCTIDQGGRDEAHTARHTETEAQAGTYMTAEEHLKQQDRRASNDGGAEAPQSEAEGAHTSPERVRRHSVGEAERDHAWYAEVNGLLRGLHFERRKRHEGS